MSAVKILIVDDEVLIAELIKSYLAGFGYNHLFLAHTKKTAIQMIEHMNPDLVLLDLYLQQPKDGLEIANTIDEKGDIPYIFITANADMLIIQEAIHTKASGYITKPIKKTDLFAVIQIALNTIDSKEVKFLQVKDNGSVIRIPHADILFIESSGNYINIHTKTQKILSRQSLDWAQEQLPEQQFLRPHRSFIVNLSAVQRFTTRSLFIQKTEIPVSRMNAPLVVDFLKGQKK